jgi:hypothetical protein
MSHGEIRIAGELGNDLYSVVEIDGAPYVLTSITEGGDTVRHYELATLAWALARADFVESYPGNTEILLKGFHP